MTVHILLSSAATPRYKQDILRCLASPMNATVQFRYAKKYVGKEVLERVNEDPCRTEQRKALVCFADVRPEGQIRLVPVRMAAIEAVVVHGTTLSVTLRMREIVHGDADHFTEQIRLQLEKAPLAKDNATSEQKFLFAIPNDERTIEGLHVAATIEHWERTVEQLQKTEPFANEPFFWTVLGAVDSKLEGSREEQFRNWDDDLKPDASCCLLIYHYRPQSGDLPVASLKVDVGGPLESGSPELIEIDSRYDLKRWFFSTKSALVNTQHGWIRIRANESWNLDLRATLPGSLLSFIWKGALAGLFIASPAIANAVGRHSNELTFSWTGEPNWPLIAEIVVCVVAGWVAGFLVLFFGSVPRVRP